MIEHIVLFRFKPETSEQTQATISQQMNALRELIPGVIDLSFGRNFTDRNQGYQYGLVVRFADRQGLADYQVHPAHQRVVTEHIRPALAELLAVDYEFTR